MRITLPRRLGPDEVARLSHLLAEAREAALVSLVGPPGSFCEGAALPLPSEGAGTAAFAGLLHAIERTPCPIVALVDGPALGGGLGVAAAADLVLASPSARFGLPETLLGLLPAVVLPFVVRRAGVSRARLLALGIEPLTAEAAREWGLVDEVVDDLEAALGRHARRFGRMDRRALAAVKQLVATHFAAPPQYLPAAAERQRELLASEPTAARIARFLGGDAPWPEEETP